MRSVASVASTARPIAPPTCTVVLTRPEARPESSGVAPDIASVISAGKARPAPRPIRTVARQHVDDEGAVDRRAREQQQAGADQRRGWRAACCAGRSASLSGPEKRERHDAHHERRGQEREADLERVVAEDALQVERAEEEQAEHADHEQRHHEVGAGDVARAEQAQRHQRVGDARLADEEGGEQRDGDARRGRACGREAQPCSVTPRIV